MVSLQTRVIVSYVSIFLLSKQLKYPVPGKLVDLIENNLVGVLTLMFGTAWAATQDIKSSMIGIVIYAASISIFHKKDPNKKYNTFSDYLKKDKEPKEHTDDSKESKINFRSCKGEYDMLNVKDPKKFQDFLLKNIEYQK